MPFGIAFFVFKNDQPTVLLSPILIGNCFGLARLGGADDRLANSNGDSALCGTDGGISVFVDAITEFADLCPHVMAAQADGDWMLDILHFLSHEAGDPFKLRYEERQVGVVLSQMMVPLEP